MRMFEIIAKSPPIRHHCKQTAWLQRVPKLLQIYMMQVFILSLHLCMQRNKTARLRPRGSDCANAEALYTFKRLSLSMTFTKNLELLRIFDLLLWLMLITLFLLVPDLQITRSKPNKRTIIFQV